MVEFPEHIENILEKVCDPEVPVLSILDLGIVRQVEIPSETRIVVTITPTYSGCPAMHLISSLIHMELKLAGYEEVEVKEQLSPAWTTDWMTDSGKKKLQEYGIAPPQYQTKNNPSLTEDVIVPCPRCESTHTTLISLFGSTSCKSLYKCKDCLEPFDYFKCH